MRAFAGKTPNRPFIIHTFFIIAYPDRKVNIIFKISAPRVKKFAPRARGANKNIYSSSFSQLSAQASEGMRQSPLGDRLTEPTLTPSGKQERLNCCEKNRL